MLKLEESTQSQKKVSHERFIRVVRLDPSRHFPDEGIAREVTTDLMDEGMVRLRRELADTFPDWHVSVEYGDAKATVVEPHEPLVLEKVHQILDVIREDLRQGIGDALRKRLPHLTG